MRSCRGELEVTGQRRAEERARGAGRADKVLESCAAQAASCAWRKVGAAFPGGGKLRRGGSPSRPAIPRGRPRSGRSRRLTVGTLSHFLLVAYPSPVASAGESCPRPSAGSGVGGFEEGGSTTESPHIHPLPAVETCPAGLPGAPRPLCPLYLGDLAFVNCVHARL